MRLYCSDETTSCGVIIGGFALQYVAGALWTRIAPRSLRPVPGSSVATTPSRAKN